MKIVALRETPKGYKLTELSIAKTCHGEFRKYCHDSDLIYKRWEFAKKKCISFFKYLYKGDVKYYGTITNEQFRGELATNEEYDFFN